MNEYREDEWGESRAPFMDNMDLVEQISAAMTDDDESLRWPYLVVARTPDESEDYGYRFIFGTLFGTDEEMPPLVQDTILQGAEYVAREAGRHLDDGDWGEDAEVMIADMSRVADLGPVPMIFMPLRHAMAVTLARHSKGEDEIINLTSDLRDADSVPAEWLDEYGSGNPGHGGYL